MESKKVLNKIFDFFVKSNDFNGIPITTLSTQTNIEYLELIENLKELVKELKISVQNNINPHIIHVKHYNIEKQLIILEEAKSNKTTKISEHINISFDSHLVCVYPSTNYLKEFRNISNYKNAPFTCDLALGEPQLKPYYFNIEILDKYIKDPRYSFKFEDYSGEICYTEDENNIPLVDDEDQIFLKTFGLGLNINEERVIVVYLRYLKGLTEEHQKYWKSKEVKIDCTMLYEYHENTMNGNFTNSISVFSGFIAEQKALNELAYGIFDNLLFNKTFENEKRPKEFTFFFIPTLKNYHDFVLLLDKMISDNINKKFFSEQNVELFELKEIEDKIFERTNKGTLRLLEEWLLDKYKVDEKDLIKKLIKPLKKIRDERQSPAHRINENVYDKIYIEKQKELMQETYFTMRTLRQIFERHPKSKLVEIEKWIDEVEIKNF